MDHGNKKIILGLSGGVDSTAAALLLKEKGFHVTGLYFDVRGKSGGDEEMKARKTAQELGIPLIVKDVSAQFEDVVVKDFCEKYMSGYTPNPCVICNPLIKFRILADEARIQGAGHIATGHYARKERIGNVWYVKKAVNMLKDQSYMLYRLPQDILEMLVLPLGEIASKDEVRKLALSKDMGNARSKDSQEICFLDGSYSRFIQDRGYEPIPGDFVDTDGKLLGKHKGLVNYTVGQRKHLGVALGRPVFVIKLSGRDNKVVLGDDRDLFHARVVSHSNVFPWMGKKASVDPSDVPGELEICNDGEHSDKNPYLVSIPAYGKIRYGARAEKCVMNILPDGKVEAVFETPQRAPAPGQSIVFYQNDLVIGGGFISAY